MLRPSLFALALLVPATALAGRGSDPTQQADDQCLEEAAATAKSARYSATVDGQVVLDASDSLAQLYAVAAKAGNGQALVVTTSSKGQSALRVAQHCLSYRAPSVGMLRVHDALPSLLSGTSAAELDGVAYELHSFSSANQIAEFAPANTEVTSCGDTLGVPAIPLQSGDWSLVRVEQVGKRRRTVALRLRCRDNGCESELGSTCEKVARQDEGWDCRCTGEDTLSGCLGEMSEHTVEESAKAERPEGFGSSLLPL